MRTLWGGLEGTGPLCAEGCCTGAVFDGLCERCTLSEWNARVESGLDTVNLGLDTVTASDLYTATAPAGLDMAIVLEGLYEVKQLDASYTVFVTVKTVKTL